MSYFHGGLLARLVVVLACAIQQARCQSDYDNADTDASPRVIRYNGQIGPDGPWNVISQAVDYDPSQNITMLPSLTNISYGLHVGSVSLGINGSLVIGGYDRSRCLTTPITSSNQTFQLLDIGIGVSDGASAYSNMKKSSTSASGLLRNDSSQAVSQLQVLPNPGVPYLHLPAETCSAIARRLPVTFDSDLGLYLWNTSAPSYTRILSSPHYLSFTFASSSLSSSSTPDGNTIYVPFALLNLTLTSPIVSTPTQYFPCSPYTPSSSSPSSSSSSPLYHLGRAFLQSAYLSQNWQTNLTFLSQSPGPDTATLAAEEIISIAPTDTSITPMVNAPAWDSTWSGVLAALVDDDDNDNDDNDDNDDDDDEDEDDDNDDNDDASSPKLPPGAIAGIVLGAVAILTGLIFSCCCCCHRRKRERRNHTAGDDATSSSPHGSSASNGDGGSTSTVEKAAGVYTPFDTCHELGALTPSGFDTRVGVGDGGERNAILAEALDEQGFEAPPSYAEVKNKREFFEVPV